MSAVALSVVNIVAGTASQIAVSGTVNDPIVAIANNPILPGTGSFVVPVGTTGQRLLQGAGSLRFNTTTGFFEGSTDGATWVNLAVGGGGVASVTGTLNRITATAGPNVVIDIAATYVGQASITTLGTITTGTWNGSLIPLAFGGTNANLTASNGGLVYSTAGALAILAGTATANQIPLSGSNAAPSWSTATYPATTTINQILYSSAANTITGLATANRAVLTTGTTGIPVLTALATDGQVIIGSTAGVPAAATLTAGTGVTITNASNSITIAVTGGAAVTSVSGTLNRITSTGGTTPVIDISAAYVGQTSITTLGTITTGVWNGSVIPLAFGGTNANLTASNGGIVWSNASQFQILAGVAAAGKMLQSGNTAAPTWSTPTYPSASGAAGKILRSDGTNNVYSTATFADTYAASNILYSNGANTVTGLATANSAVLVTTAAGVPVMSSTMTNGQIIIGSTGATPTAATITAGAGITVTNGAGTITIASVAGSGAGLKSFQIFTSGTAQTYTPTAGTVSILVEVLGGGGGGGSVDAVANQAAASGGGGGGYARKWYAAIAASYTYTVGATANGGASGGTNNGTAGNNSSFDVITANGGGSGIAVANQVVPFTNNSIGAGGSASGGDINLTGQAGGPSWSPNVVIISGAGGNSTLGAGGEFRVYSSGAALAGLSAAANSGGGGSGAASGGSAGSAAGGNGAAGLIVVWEFT